MTPLTLHSKFVICFVSEVQTIKFIFRTHANICWSCSSIKEAQHFILYLTFLYDLVMLLYFWSSVCFLCLSLSLLPVYGFIRDVGKVTKRLKLL